MNQNGLERKSMLFKILDNYLIDTGSLLGQGQYGKVYKGYGVNNYGRIYAIKETPLQGKNMSEVILIRKKEAAIREIKGLKELNHPNIIRFINVKQTNKHLYLIMEYCEGGSLENYIEQNLPDERECLYFFSQIVSAFQYLIKQKKRKHGDIKPANILLHNRQIKLADFGFSKKFVEESDQSNSYAGSPLFTSPQILEGKAYSTKSEIWSLGVTLYFMLCYNATKRAKSFPWWGATDIQLMREIHSCPQVRFSTEKEEILSLEVRQLLRRMLEVEEENRMDWSELFSCPLFSFDLAQDTIYNKYIEDDEEEKSPGKLQTSQAVGEREIFSFHIEPEFLTAHYIKNHEESTHLESSLNGVPKSFSSSGENTQGPSERALTLGETQGEITKQNITLNMGQTISESQYPVTSIDVIHQQAENQGDECLQSIQQSELQNRLLNELEDYITEERQLSYFIYKTSKSVKECFQRFNLIDPNSYLDVKLLFVLCKRSKIISEEIIHDILLERSVQLLKPSASIIPFRPPNNNDNNSTFSNIPMNINIPPISNKPYVPIIPSSFSTLNNIKQGTSMNYQPDQSKSKSQMHITAQKVQQAAQATQTAYTLRDNSLLKNSLHPKREVVIISKDHWRHFTRNSMMKQSYITKLNSESSIYHLNYFCYKERLQTLIKQDTNPSQEDLEELSCDDTNIRLTYEAHVLTQALHFFQGCLQRIIFKMQASENPQSDINEEDLRLLYLVEDILMIYTFESTFRMRTFTSRTTSLNIQQFYFMRKRSPPTLILSRISQAYKALFMQ